MEIKQLDYLYKLLKVENIEENASLKDYSNFKIGGKAKIMLFPTSLKICKKLFKFLCKNHLKFVVLGNATNVLIDGDLDVVVSTKKMDLIKRNKNKIYAECGVSLFSLCEFAKNNSLSGLERLYGIPASIGGGIVQNCGAYTHNISDHLEKVILFDGKKIKKVKKEYLEFSYRTSIFKKNKNWIVLGAIFSLNPKLKEEIHKTMTEIFNIRKEKQPYEYPSCGSVFKRYEGVIISKLIDELGLKGYSVGGAKISEKHAGFIINYDNATYDDVINLINLIKNKIKIEKNIDLNLEIVLL